LGDNRRRISLLAIIIIAMAAGSAFPQELTAPSGIFHFRDMFNSSPTVIDTRLIHVGSVTSQGDSQLNAGLARSTYGVSGSGIKVGIISDSFNSLGGAAAGIASGELPGIGNPTYPIPVNVLLDDTGSDEGRGMAEIVHDVAPGAELMFHAAFSLGGKAGLAQAIDNLVASGANVIVDDVGFLTEPFFQNGIVAQAVNRAYHAGIAYFSSAGNQGNEGYMGYFSDNGSNRHNFDLNNDEGGDAFLNISVPSGRSVRVALEWSDPYLSLGGSGPISDFDAALVDMETGQTVSTSTRDQTAGVDPWELVYAQNTTDMAKQYGLVIDRYAGDANRLLKAIVYDSGAIADDDDTNSPTLVGHAAAEGAAAIASVRYDQNEVEWYSSQGPTLILFDENGNPINETRQTPMLAASDGADTSFFGSGDWDGTGFPNFFGTSASAPHVAAVAALMLEWAHDFELSLTPDQVFQILSASAVDLGSAGFDTLSGYGLIDAAAAIAGIAVPISGDTDHDGDVDLVDLGNLATHYGATGGGVWSWGDFDHDSDVDLSDLGLLATNYGVGVGSPLNFEADLANVLPMVPEPVSVVLLIFGASLLSGVRRVSR